MESKNLVELADLTVLESGLTTGIPINYIIVHVQWHADELFAAYLLRKFGKQHFPGIENAKVVFARDIQFRGDDYYDQRQQLPVGSGGGRFDEHRENGRLDNMSACRLVARYLNLEYDQDFKPLISRINHCDNNAGCHGFELSELVKVMGRRMSGGEHLLLKVFEPVFEALTDTAIVHVAKSGEKSLVDLFREWIERSDRHDKVRARMFQLAHESVRSENITSLSNMTTQLQRRGMSVADVQEWVMTVFEQVYADQLEFWNVLAEVEKSVKTHVLHREVPISIVTHDNPLALKAMRYRKERVDGIIVIRQKKGNTQIFVGDQDISTLVAMLRWMELPPELKNDVSWRELQKAGEFSIIGNTRMPIWYHDIKAGALYNGSTTHPDVPPTKMADRAIIEAVQHAFDYSLILRWKSVRGIRQ